MRRCAIKYIKGIGDDRDPIHDGVDLRIGDTVVVQRASNIIPQVRQRHHGSAEERRKPYKFTDACRSAVAMPCTKTRRYAPAPAR